MRGFHRPYALPQPIHQRTVVGVPAKKRLAQVNVRLDEPGQDEPAARVDGFGMSPGKVSPDRGDTSVLNRHVAVDDVETIVHRDDQPVANEQRQGGSGLTTIDSWSTTRDS